MTEILREIHKYVPVVYDENGKIIDVLEPIPFGGDQLTEERSINAMAGFTDGKTKYEELKGLTPKFEDWHLKKAMYEVKRINFYTKDKKLDYCYLKNVIRNSILR